MRTIDKAEATRRLAIRAAKDSNPTMTIRALAVLFQQHVA